MPVNVGHYQNDKCFRKYSNICLKICRYYFSTSKYVEDFYVQISFKTLLVDIYQSNKIELSQMSSRHLQQMSNRHLWVSVYGKDSTGCLQRRRGGTCAESTGGRWRLCNRAERPVPGQVKKKLIRKSQILKRGLSQFHIQRSSRQYPTGSQQDQRETRRIQQSDQIGDHLVSQKKSEGIRQ